MATQLKPEPVSGLETAGSSAPARPASRGPSRAALPIAVFTAAACLYLSTLSQHYSEGEDSADYVAQVTRATRVSDCFRPNHLLYLAFNRLVYDGFRLVGYTGNAALPMKVVSVLAGAISLCLLLLILRQVGVTDRLGLVWVAVITSCYGFWSYSTQAETYTLPIPFLLIALMIFVGLAEGPFSPWQFFWFGVSNALVTLLQQMHVVLYPVLILAPVALWYRRRAETPFGRLVTGLAVFGAASALIVGAAYFAVALGPLGMSDLATIIYWSKGHGNNGPFSPVKWANPIISIISITHTIAGGHFMFGFDWFYELVVRRIPHKLMIEEQYLAATLPAAVRMACLAGAIMASVAGLCFIGPLLFTRRTPLDAARSLRLLAVDVFVWPILLITFLFTTIMEPATIEWWVAPLPLAAVGLASLQARRSCSRAWWPAGAVCAVGLFLANGFGAILPQSDLRADYWYQVNGFLIRNALPGDVILTDGGFISDQYLSLYTGAAVEPFHVLGSARLSQLLSESRTGRIWISSWVFEPLPDVARLVYFSEGVTKNHELASNRARLASLRGRMAQRDETSFQTIWQLIPAGNQP